MPGNDSAMLQNIQAFPKQPILLGTVKTHVVGKQRKYNKFNVSLILRGMKERRGRSRVLKCVELLLAETDTCLCPQVTASTVIAIIILLAKTTSIMHTAYVYICQCKVLATWSTSQAIGLRLPIKSVRENSHDQFNWLHCI